MIVGDGGDIVVKQLIKHISTNNGAGYTVLDIVLCCS